MDAESILRELIHDLEMGVEADLQAYEGGARSGFVVLKYVEDIGMLFPTCWVEVYLPGYIHKWEKFMYGQSFMLGQGYHIRDGLRFLDAVRMGL